jgi:hypothetical protein
MSSQTPTLPQDNLIIHCYLPNLHSIPLLSSIPTVANSLTGVSLSKRPKTPPPIMHKPKLICWHLVLSFYSLSSHIPTSSPCSASAPPTQSKNMATIIPPPYGSHLILVLNLSPKYFCLLPHSGLHLFNKTLHGIYSVASNDLQPLKYPPTKSIKLLTQFTN